jgi:hypothetical protein
VELGPSLIQLLVEVIASAYLYVIPYTTDHDLPTNFRSLDHAVGQKDSSLAVEFYELGQREIDLIEIELILVRDEAGLRELGEGLEVTFCIEPKSSRLTAGDDVETVTIPIPIPPSSQLRRNREAIFLVDGMLIVPCENHPKTAISFTHFIPLDGITLH